jgi:hypothetical protein
VTISFIGIGSHILILPSISVTIMWIFRFTCLYTNSMYHLYGMSFDYCPWRDVHVFDSTSCDEIWEWHAAGWCSSPCTVASYANKTDGHNINWNIVDTSIIYISSTLDISHFIFITLLVKSYICTCTSHPRHLHPFVMS